MKRKLNNKQKNRLTYLRRRVSELFSIDTRNRRVNMPYDVDTGNLPGKTRDYLLELSGVYGYSLQQFIH